MDTAILFVAIIGLVIWLLATQERISRLAWRLERLEKQALKSSEEPQKAPVRFVQTEVPREVSVKEAEKAKVSQKASSEFTIIKLFSWIGGFALLLAAAFWVKYALENNLISPQMRIGAGLLTGLALWVAGLYLKNPGYKTTSNTLCACGLTICYIISFAGYALYGMFALPLTFGLLAFISLATFCTAV